MQPLIAVKSPCTVTGTTLSACQSGARVAGLPASANCHHTKVELGCQANYVSHREAAVQHAASPTRRLVCWCCAAHSDAIIAPEAARDSPAIALLYTTGDVKLGSHQSCLAAGPDRHKPPGAVSSMSQNIENIAGGGGGCFHWHT